MSNIFTHLVPLPAFVRSREYRLLVLQLLAFVHAVLWCVLLWTFPAQLLIQAAFACAMVSQILIVRAVSHEEAFLSDVRHQSARSAAGVVVAFARWWL